MTMKRLILTALLFTMAMPLLASAAYADMRPADLQEKKRPNPTPKPGPRDDGEGDQ